MTLDERLIKTVPTPRQVEHQQTEFYGFIHFTVNTFTDREWGDGTEDPVIFNPVKLDTDQWAKSFKAAEMKGMILTCKHHDGFCLWPSRFTEHSVKNSPYKNGNGDIVKEAADSCRKYGLKFGIYLSPWDRHCTLYGKGKEYDDYFVSQLTELLTQYGELFTVWFDGACGEGPNGKKQVYDWQRYYDVIRKTQPNACIAVCGPDVRWCGNEAGHTRPSEWSVVPGRLVDAEKTAENSQKEDDAEFRTRIIKSSDIDLGSREVMAGEDNFVWYPAEVNTSIRPGWFWHKSENDKVRPLVDMIKIYYNSVGGNATFLLNVPPTNEGILHENDVKRLEEIGDYLKKSFSNNLLKSAVITADSESPDHPINSVLTDNYDIFYSPEEGVVNPVITIKFDSSIYLSNIVLKENILYSQRIESFSIDINESGIFNNCYNGTVVGYKRIVKMNGVKTDCIRIRITDSRKEPTLAFIGIYSENE
jgi:alpha-L-fucosidase